MGLVINNTTGTIDLSASTPGTYTVRYTTENGFATTQVIVENCSSGGGDGEEAEGERDGGE